IDNTKDLVRPELLPASRVLSRLPRPSRLEVERGKVVIQIVVRKNGSVADARILSAKPCDCGFEDEILAGVRRYRYRPGTIHGTPVDVLTTLVIEFSKSQERLGD